MNPDGTDQMEYYRQQLLLAELDLLRRPIPGHPTKVVAVISGHHGVPRMGELVSSIRPGPARGRRRRAAHSRLRQAGAAGHRRPIWSEVLAEVPPSLSAERQVLPRRHASRRRSRSGASTWSTCSTTCCCCRGAPGYALLEPVPFRKTPTPPVIPDQRESRAARTRRCILTDVYAGPGWRRAARDGQEAAALRATLRLPGMGGHINIGIDGPWDVHRILGTVPVEADGSASFKRAGQHADRRPAAGRRRPGAAGHAQLVHGHAGRDALLRRLPRDAEHDATGASRTAGHAPPAVGNHALARPGPRLQLRARSPAGAGQVLRRLPRRRARRPTAGEARLPPRLSARQEAATAGATSPVLPGPAPLRPPARSGERLPSARAAGVPRRHQRTGPDARRGPPQREARRRGMGPAGHLDRPERARPRHLERAPLDPPAITTSGGWRCARSTPIARRPGGLSHASARKPAFVEPAPVPEARPQNLTCRGWPFDAAEAKRRQAAAARSAAAASARSNWATARWSSSWFPPGSSSWATPPVSRRTSR